MDYSFSNFENKGLDKKTMTYLGIVLVIIFVLIFFVFVFNQGEEMKGFKSIFDKKEKNKKQEYEDEEENAQEIVEKALNNTNLRENKCKNKVYKKLGISSCTSKYVPPI